MLAANVLISVIISVDWGKLFNYYGPQDDNLWGKIKYKKGLSCR